LIKRYEQQKNIAEMLQRDKTAVLTLLVGNDRVGSARGGPYAFGWNPSDRVVFEYFNARATHYSYKEAGHDQPIR
jgi:hypothetical protein